MPTRAQAAQMLVQVPQAHYNANFIGQALDGKYRIEAKLGSGGMGDVYRATRLLIGDVVAVKILHPHLARDPQAAERFRREAVMATKLRHRNVVGIYDVGISAAHNLPYILMELAEGYTLRQMINQYRVLPLDFAVTVTTQICSALDEAHALGIVHRDIKPENIVANQTSTGWYIKVLDFGIAKLYNQGDIGLTQDGNAMGTPQYMSPEQCLGEPLDARSDIYSVGILLYEMLAGTVPFKSPTPSAIAIHHVQTDPAPPRTLNSEIHPDVEALILKSLAKQRELRPQKASELARELISAATSAFKSGFAAVPSAPIPAPNVEPEFDGAADVENPLPDETVSEPPPVVVDEPISVVDDDLSRVFEESPPPGLPEDRTMDSVSEVSEQEAVDPLSQVESLVVSDEPLRDDEPLDMAGLLEDAELRLDEILAVEKDGVEKEISEEKEVVEKEIAAPILPTSSETTAKDESSAHDDETLTTSEQIPAENSAEAALPDLEMAVPQNKGLPNLAIIGGAISILLILGVVGVVVFAYLLLPNVTEPAANTNSQTETRSNEPPKGMQLVPGGEFMIGSEIGDEFSKPAHRVTVLPFYMDITEVTNEDYKKFVDETKRKPPPNWKNGTFPDGRALLPVTGVNWEDAAAFAKWADKRLPTEVEWEFAARGTDGRTYPWGNDWKPEFANAANQLKGMREVGKGDGRSPFGMLDMSGNAFEWTSSDAISYPGGAEFPKDVKPRKIIRGGYWGSKPENATSFERSAYPIRDADGGYPNMGIRCVKDIDK